MNKRTRIGLTLLLTVILVLAMAIPGAAKKEANFNLTYEFTGVDWDKYYDTGGTFSLEGVIEDDGDATIHWIPIWGEFELMKGTMIFDGSDWDSFTIRYNLTAWDGETQCAFGTFQIYVSQGTGVYEGMWGSGEFTECRPGMGDDVYGWLNGLVKFPK